jgi:hypothetical protein
METTGVASRSGNTMMNYDYRGITPEPVNLTPL